MRSKLRLSSALALALIWATPVLAAPRGKTQPASDGAKKSGKEISTDDRALDKQMDWENKLLGPNTQKKIDLAKIQKLQAEELARREKQEKIEQVEKDRREREAAAAAAAQRNVKAPSTRDVPMIQEAPQPPTKPVEKHDDAFVDKLLTGKAEKKKVAVSNDEVDLLLNKAKQEKSPTGGSGKGRGNDTVDQLLATADKQASIKTTTRKPADGTESVSAEAAAREAALKAIASTPAAKAQEERNRRRLAVPDAAVLRAQSTAKTTTDTAPKPSAARAGWIDPFASDAPVGVGSKNRGKSTPATTFPQRPAAPPSTAGRHSPTVRPAAPDTTWQDPFDSAGGGGGAVKPRSTPPVKPAPANRPAKHAPNWKDPFA